MADVEEISVRALEMMQALAAAYAEGEVPEGSEREIVGRRTAMDAVMQLVAVLDDALEEEGIPEEMGLHCMSMLMLIREHILSLPDPADGDELLREDLASLTQLLDEAWEA